MVRVRVYDEAGRLLHAFGSGAFASVVLARRPQLPVAEEGWLEDPVRRGNFLKRVYVHCRWRQLCASGLSWAALDAFHLRHRYLVMAHSRSALRRLNRLLAQRGCPLEAVAQAYFAQLMAALKRSPRRPDHINVLQHFGGCLRKDLHPADRLELARVIGDYRCGQVPLSVPFGLLRQHLSRIGEHYPAAQYYLEPYPPALGMGCG